MNERAGALRKRSLQIAALLGIAVLALYARTLGFGFVNYDDDKYIVANLEYVLVTVGPAKLLAFGDAGNSYHESQKFDVFRLRTSVGAELRVFLPIFQAPLRFIYSFNLHPLTPIDQFGFPINSLKERRSGFDFSIGRTF